MLEFFLVIIVIIGLLFLMPFDALGSKLDKLALKLGLQDEPSTNENLGSLKESLVGNIAIAEVDFIRLQAEACFDGRVKARGTEWRAKQISGDRPLSKGAKVVIKKVEGNKLFVEAFDNAQKESE